MQLNDQKQSTRLLQYKTVLFTNKQHLQPETNYRIMESQTLVFECTLVSTQHSAVSTQQAAPNAPS